MLYPFCILTPSQQHSKGAAEMNAQVHVTIENVEKLAKAIAAKHAIPMVDARDLAEFNLTYAPSYEAAAARV